ncbi:MAG: hypothetical protein RI996_268 [Candidatus Parcubacteria bacterium]|jgi:flagellar basal body-associated protein FliL
MERKQILIERESSMQSKSTQKSGVFSKIKMIVFLAVVLAIVFFIGSTLGVNTLRQMRAETQVTRFVKALYPDQSVVGKICQGEDTDTDGYVSCAVTLTLRENPLSVQCPTILKSYLGTTCRLTPGTSPVNI